MPEINYGCNDVVIQATSAMTLKCDEIKGRHMVVSNYFLKTNFSNLYYYHYIIQMDNKLHDMRIVHYIFIIFAFFLLG